MAKKVSDVFPMTVSIPLKDPARAARIGTFTFAHLIWIESEFGSFDDFRNATWTATLINKVIFQLLENKEDFRDELDFAAQLPMTAVLKLKQVLESRLEASLVNETPAANGGTGRRAARK